MRSPNNEAFPFILAKLKARVCGKWSRSKRGPARFHNPTILAALKFRKYHLLKTLIPHRQPCAVGATAGSAKGIYPRIFLIFLGAAAITN